MGRIETQEETEARIQKRVDSEHRSRFFRQQQLAEIASEHDFDRSIDHSQPHDPTDMEKAFDEINKAAEDADDPHQTFTEPEQIDEEQEFFDAYVPGGEIYERGFESGSLVVLCQCEDYPCCGH